MQLPQALIESIKNAPGFNGEAFEEAHALQEKITSIRVNPLKIHALTAPFITADMQPVPWSSTGYYLPERPSFTFDPLFHGGLYYVQEASSMFLEQAVKQSADLSMDLKVLDLCGAPGGKSTLVQGLLTPGSLLVSNDVIRARASILEENMIKWGGANTVVTNNDPKDFQKLQDFFDMIVIDAPCSGSGLFRRDPHLVKEWSLQNVELCCQRQQRILADVLPALKEDGVLVYSTCSYSQEEDEDIIEWLIKEMGMETSRIEAPAGTGIVETISASGGYGYRFYPDQVKGEGLFMAVLRKRGSGGTFYSRLNKFEKPTLSETTLLKDWMQDADDYQYIKFKNEILALPVSWSEEYLSMLSVMYIKKAGIKIGEIMNGALVPDHQLAVSGLANKALPSLELDEEDAIRYLKKETIQAEMTVKGWILVRFKGLPMGWVKALPNRMNNYYPKEWRIIKKER